MSGKIRAILVVKPKHNQPAGTSPIKIDRKPGQHAVQVFHRLDTGERKEYTVDEVLDCKPTEDLHSHLIPLVDSAIRDGNNLNMFVYGQTGSGKSCTMEGKIG